MPETPAAGYIGDLGANRACSEQILVRGVEPLHTQIGLWRQTKMLKKGVLQSACTDPGLLAKLIERNGAVRKCLDIVHGLIQGALFFQGPYVFVVLLQNRVHLAVAEEVRIRFPVACRWCLSVMDCH